MKKVDVVRSVYISNIEAVANNYLYNNPDSWLTAVIKTHKCYETSEPLVDLIFQCNVEPGYRESVR